jgi:nucleoside-diphosphate-sugar epimerase
MRIMVTGGTGFTGAALVARLLRDGHSVSVLDTKPGLALEQLEAQGADVTLGSVTDREAVARSMQGAHVVMHVAAAFRETGAPDALYKEVNVGGTRIVVEECRKAGVQKLIYCSTQGVHGNIDNPPGDENSPIAPEDYYQQTKYEGEGEVRAHAGDLEYTILRPTAIYGPGDPERFYMIFRRVAKGRFVMFGSGRTFYHPVYIDNLVDAFVLAMKPGIGSSEVYIIADEEYFPINELVKRVGKALNVNVSVPHLPILPLMVVGHVCERVCKPFGINPPIFPRRVDWFRQVRAFKIDKAKRDLGYVPRVGIDEGLRRTGEWYRERGLLPRA